MSSQTSVGWFPECHICGFGNIGTFCCLRPECLEAARNLPREQWFDVNVWRRTQPLQDKCGEWWSRCIICNKQVLASPEAWGSFACCFNCATGLTT